MKRRALGIGLILWAIACGSSDSSDGAGATDGGGNVDGGTSASDSGATDGSTSDGSSGSDSGTSSGPKPIFVIPMENKDSTEIYGDTTDAPFINNTLMKKYAYATSFTDELTHAIPSEPHYVWMESGTNDFTDNTFTTDNDPSSANSTASTEHLATQLTAAGISWTSYQEGITSGTCPIDSIGKPQFYAAKHNPFVFFQDVTGTPLDAGAPSCAAHHKPLSSLSGDLTSSAVATYNFITPNLCHDMHGDSNCPQGTDTNMNIAAGDTWLHDNLQPIIDYALAHDGYVFITWDEGDALNLMPFIAIGKNVVAGHDGTVTYNHSSLLKSEEEILGVPVLSKASSASDFADLFAAGTFP